MVRYRQSDGERVGRERRLLYGLNGLYDGSDGGDCGDGNGKDGVHHRVHDDDGGSNAASNACRHRRHSPATHAHQFAAHSNKKPRKQEK